MPALKLLAKLIVYYAAVTSFVLVGVWLFPNAREFIPIGRAQALIAETYNSTSKLDVAKAAAAHFTSLAGSLMWLSTAVIGALVTALPISWVYMEVRDEEQYDQSLIDTIVILPLVVTGIVVIVQHSLALSFSLAGIAGAARFRNSMKSSGDLLFILLSIAIGLATGIGAMELAIVCSMGFNFALVALWSLRYGERKGMKRFLSDVSHGDHNVHRTSVEVSSVTVSTVVASSDEAKPG